MTTRVQFVITDDLDEHEHPGTYTDIGPDGQKIVFSVDGFVREIDLTARHAEEFRAFLQRYIKAGHEPGQAPQPALPTGPPPKLTGQGKRRELPGTREFYKGLRDWCAEVGIEIPTAGRDDSKKNYVYTSQATEAYLAHLRAEQEQGTDGGTAAAQLAIAAMLGLTPPVPAGT
jgi:hypothetical protein